MDLRNGFRIVKFLVRLPEHLVCGTPETLAKSFVQKKVFSGWFHLKVAVFDVLHNRLVSLLALQELALEAPALTQIPHIQQHAGVPAANTGYCEFRRKFPSGQAESHSPLGRGRHLLPARASQP